MQIDIARRKFGRIFILSVLVICISIGIAIGINRYYTISVIRIEGSNVHATIDEKRIPKNLLFFPSEKFRSEILRSNPLLSDVRFIKYYPHTLAIIPVPRIPYVVLRSGNRQVFIDREGYVLGDADNRLVLTSLELDHVTLHTGEKIGDPRVIFLIAFIEKVSDMLSIKSITNVDTTQYLVKTDKTDIFITQDKPVSDITATLQTLITGFRIKGTLPSVVDLRFDKPVVKF